MTNTDSQKDVLGTGEIAEPEDRHALPNDKSSRDSPSSTEAYDERSDAETKDTTESAEMAIEDKEKKQTELVHSRLSMPSLIDSLEDGDEEADDDEQDGIRHTEPHSTINKPTEESNSSKGSETEPTKTTSETYKLFNNETVRDNNTFSEKPSSPEITVWSDYVRKGARLKTFLDDALHKVASGFSTKESEGASGGKRPMSSVTGESPTQDRPVRRRIDEYTADIAREKTAEVTILKMKLKEAEAEAAALFATNSTLREAAATSAERMERTTEALRIAGTNAANARADADTAEANAAALSKQLQALKNMVYETKTLAEVLHSEHEQVSEATRSVETRLMQSESEKGRMEKEQKRLIEERDGLSKRMTKIVAERDALSTKLNDANEHLEGIKKVVEEREAVELVRIDRSRQIENELRETRAMLMDATAASADTETTTALLNDCIDELRRENRTLHERVESFQDGNRKEHERLSEALDKLECEAQKLRVKATADKDEMERLRLDRKSSESHVTELKLRISGLERRLKDSSHVSPSPLTEKLNGNADSSVTTKRVTAFSIPPLGVTTPKTPRLGKENLSTNVSTRKNHISSKLSVNCCLCYKEAFGLMKSCQCGKQTCDKRAHAKCVASNDSLSSTGPVVLCESAST